MKKYLLFFLAAFVIISCKKDDDNYTWGEANAILNNEIWDAETYGAPAPAFPDGYIGINLDVKNGSGFLRQSLVIHKVPLEKGVYDLGVAYTPHDYPYVSMQYFTTLDDGDVVGDVYYLDSLAVDNRFEVLNYSESKKEIEIEFAATFLLDRKYHDDAPDTLIFEDGYIKTRVNL